MMKYERLGKKTCDMTDCFANNKDLCRLLVEAIHNDCPFYKQVSNEDTFESCLDTADEETIRYADKLIEDRKEAMQKAKETVSGYRNEIDNLRRAKKKIKEEREKRVKIELLDSN